MVVWVLIAVAACAPCTALRVRQQDPMVEPDLLVAAQKPPQTRLRRWLEKPATKSILLVAAGGLSGAVAKSATAPLERVKLMSQAGQTKHVWTLMTDVVQAEGWRGLWRGNTANVIRVIPNKGVLLMCSDMYKATVSSLLPAANGATISSVAGGLAGITAVLATYPLELVRTRMAYRICEGAMRNQYASILSTLRSVVLTNGPLGLYAGIGMTLVGTLPFEAIKFGTYDTLKQLFPRDADGRIGPMGTLLTGATAGALAHTLTYPLDTIRRRMQISGATGVATYTGVGQCCRLMLEKEGAGAFFYGLAPTVIRSLPNLGIQFLMYETIKAALGFEV
jgi:solute carrier family 25 phosphate transporter 23/24/25/41